LVVTVTDDTPVESIPGVRMPRDTVDASTPIVNDVVIVRLLVAVQGPTPPFESVERALQYHVPGISIGDVTADVAPLPTPADDVAVATGSAASVHVATLQTWKLIVPVSAPSGSENVAVRSGVSSEVEAPSAGATSTVLGRAFELTTMVRYVVNPDTRPYRSSLCTRHM
jgi:hypothetical protein